MLINNTNISKFNAVLLTKDIQSADVITYNDWLRNALSPLFFGKEEQYKQLKLKLYIKDKDEESALKDISNIVKEFEKCTLKFDDLNYMYDCILSSKSHERVALGIYNLNIELKSGYAYVSQVDETLNNEAGKIIYVKGNLPSSAIVKVTVPIDTISVTITGFGNDPITINNLKANVPVIIDGETCTVLENGLNKFNDVDMWEYPVLEPGKCSIAVDTANSIVDIIYKPRFM